jgi:hypothetical protein
MNGRNLLDFSPHDSTQTLAQRTYRTRKDPFAKEWPGIIEILTANSEIGAKAILELLILESPDEYNWTHLRTLQRGIRRWRDQQAERTPVSIEIRPLAVLPPGTRTGVGIETGVGIRTGLGTVVGSVVVAPTFPESPAPVRSD